MPFGARKTPAPPPAASVDDVCALLEQASTAGVETRDGLELVATAAR
jgi:hypothetical protein